VLLPRKSIRWICPFGIDGLTLLESQTVRAGCRFWIGYRIGQICKTIRLQLFDTLQIMFKQQIEVVGRGWSEGWIA